MVAFCLSAALHAAIIALAERTPAPPEASGETVAPITVEIIEEAPLPAALPEAAAVPAAPKGEPATAVAPAQQQHPAVPEPATASLPPPRPRPSAIIASRTPEISHAPPAANPAPTEDMPTDDAAPGMTTIDSPATPAAADASPASAAGSVSGQKDRDGRESASLAGSNDSASAQRLLDAYGRELWKRIAAHKPKGLQQVASTEISFVVAADGMLLAASVSRSSGKAELDELALQAVHAAAPFPPPPSTLTARSLTFEISFNFR